MTDSMLPATATGGVQTRVAIIAPGLAPYRIPLLNYLNRLPNIQVTALLCRKYGEIESKSDARRDWCFDYQYFQSFMVRVSNPFAERAGLWLSPGLWSHLGQNPYDVVIALGWTMPNTVLAWQYCKTHRRPVVVWDDSIPHPPGRWKRRLMPVVQRYFGSFDSYLASSSWCRDYFVSMGAPREQIIFFPQIVDNDFFARSADALRPRRDALKQELGIHTSRVILFVGQSIARKGVVPLMEAFERVAQANPDVTLVTVGQGVLTSEMQARRLASHARDRIVIHPFVSQQDLPKFYALADIFVLPSFYDTFGLVINEAMASRLPIVTTNRVGAVADLVRDGVNGRVVAPGDVPALAEALTQLVGNDALRAEMGKRAAEQIDRWSVQQAGEGFMQCINLCLGRPSST